ncbi:MAG: lysophospholipase [Lachnospiraceae bacterium]|jgi:alpha-beta hydrolase superfamily lysophospholipase|nr:lysophospholipase [Lachnospiraceae bacterium]
MVTKEELFFDSCDHISKVHAVKWIPNIEVRAIMIVAHGMAEYIERYDKLAVYLADRGILVAGNDHLGHGRSVGEKGPGYICEQDPAMVLVRDVHRLKRLLQEEYRGVPFICLGHSMGSYVIRNYLCRYENDVSGAIIVGTGMPARPLILFARALANVQALVLGGRSPGKMLNNLTFSGYNKRIDRPLSPFSWLSENEENVRAYDDDPLCGFLFSVNGFQTLFELIHRSQQKDLTMVPTDLPLFFIAGSKDPVGDYGVGVRRAMDSLRKLGMSDITELMYPTARHEVLNEKYNEEVFGEIYEWTVKKIINIADNKHNDVHLGNTSTGE